jgi:hypothetical protein
VSWTLEAILCARSSLSCFCVLDSRGDLVCTIVLEDQIFKADFFQCGGSSCCLVAGVSAGLWK